MYLDHCGSGYDERLFRLMLAEFVRRNFSEIADLSKLNEVRIAVCTPSPSYDADGDSYESQSIVVLHTFPLPVPAGPAPDRSNHGWRERLETKRAN